MITSGFVLHGLIAAALYMVVYSVLTEILKTWCAVNGGKAYLLSVLIGILIFILFAVLGLYPFNLYTVSFFVVLTGMVGFGYKFTKLKNFIKWIVSLFGINGAA